MRTPWNYRVFKVRDPSDESKVYHEIYEVYYNKCGNITGRSPEPISDLFGETLEDLQEDFACISTAFTFPVLDRGKIDKATKNSRSYKETKCEGEDNG